MHEFGDAFNVKIMNWAVRRETIDNPTTQTPAIEELALRTIHCGG